MPNSKTYQFRENALTPLNTLSLHDDGLASLCNERSQLHAYADVKSVRLKYDPTRVQTNRYLMDVEFANAPKLRVTNSSYEGFAYFKDQSDSFRGFVESFHQALADNNVNAQYLAGANSFSYIASLLCTFFVLGILVFASIYMLLTGMFLIVLIKLILIVIYLPAVFRYLKANRPRSYQPNNIPVSLLPK